MLVGVAGAIAALGLVRWLTGLTAAAPLLYGEGAVAHAAQLIRTGAAYAPRVDGSFVAANYPPLFLLLASLGAPFLAGRIVSLAATGVIAALIGWRARAAGGLVAWALALAWLASVPVLDWGVAAKPDLLAVAFVVGAVIVAERRHARWTGALLLCAIATKPTAAVPALAIAVWFSSVDRRSFARIVTGAALPGAVLTAVLLWAGPADAWRHIVLWNTLGWDPLQLALLAVVLVAVGGVPLVWAGRFSGGVTRAYLVGALGVFVLGGREGATVNYLLDAGAASLLALAAAAAPARATAGSWFTACGPPSRSRGRPGGLVAALIAAQLVAGTVALDPFGLVPGGTGHWGAPGRVDALRAALTPGMPALVEEAGLMVALGLEPIVDDLFLWSRLVERGVVDPAPLLEAVGEGRFAVIAAEADLGTLHASGPAYERGRWAAVLVAAIQARYDAGVRTGGLWLYHPR